MIRTTLGRTIRNITRGAAAVSCNAVANRTSLMNFSAINTMLSIRSFSAAPPAKQPADLTLADVLAAEMLHEQSETEIDEEYEEVKALVEQTFKITDTPGHGVIKLERNYKGENIVITFDCQDITEDIQDESQYDEFEQQAETRIEQGEDDEDFQPPANKLGINFEVTITKKKSKAVFYCASLEERVVIQNVTFVPADVEDTKAYGGPRYEDLDPAVREGFQEYLSERKIDEDFAFYVLSEARNKEEREYRYWLSNLTEFFSG